MAAEQRTYPRGTDEFSRVLAFSDGLFAISMTLLVVGIDIPDLNDADSVRELANALNDDVASFTSFVISFLVVGRYWRAHHVSFSRLAAMNDRLIEINLLYLLFIAFLPFPTGLLGNFFDNPLKGRQAFVGESHGYISSRVNLSSLAGENVKIRFRIGSDRAQGDYGWFVDEINFYTCS